MTGKYSAAKPLGSVQVIKEKSGVGQRGESVVVIGKWGREYLQSAVAVVRSREDGVIVLVAVCLYEREDPSP